MWVCKNCGEEIVGDLSRYTRVVGKVDKQGNIIKKGLIKNEEVQDIVYLCYGCNEIECDTLREVAEWIEEEE